MNNNRVKQQFEQVRQQFFPRWDRAGRWRIRQVADLNGAHGRVYPETKTIRITHLPEGEKGTVLLIHEIAHAASDWGHGRKWKARIEKAAIAAEHMGRRRLAELLRKEITGYQNPAASVTEKLVYQEIGDAASENPDATFSQVIDFVRRDYGLSRKEFLGRFRRTKKVFDQEKRDEEGRDRARAKWMATSVET